MPTAVQERLQDEFGGYRKIAVVETGAAIA
jgi:hypothetical protein